jgi:hypothetical protein
MTKESGSGDDETAPVGTRALPEAPTNEGDTPPSVTVLTPPVPHSLGQTRAPVNPRLAEDACRDGINRRRTCLRPIL